ncbi:unnamed protein product [Mytilus edulis]|uniref:Glucose-methanol-choline oxidoreductase N-terminal domain-containing protein n=1 Tax=Mytilus edulis TaxID=6550 RepID=A0A8S3PUC4_MYTED|nr:unnamed protein product [Mytilus edulis]
MFLGSSLVALCANASLLNFLSTQLPDEKDPEGIFDQPFKKYYDYIVVGSGSAGGIIATRLSEDPVRVLLLEAGGSNLENEYTRIPLPWKRALKSKVNWGFYTVPQKYSSFASKNKKAKATRGKVLGGTGSMNGMNYVRGSRHDFDQWRNEGCHFMAEEVLWLSQKPIRHRWNFFIGLPPLRKVYQLLTVMAITRLVIIRNGTARGVTVMKNGRTTRVYAKEEVILSAGVFGSPQILLLSGIGPKAHLQKVGVPLKVDLPVGEGMQDHMQYFFQYSTNTSLNMNQEKALDQREIMEYVFYKKGVQTRPGNDGTIFAHLPDNENDHSYPDLQLSFKAFANEKDPIKCAVDRMNKRGDFAEQTRTASIGFAVLICKLHHKSRGTLRLKSKNPLAPPRIDPNYLSHQDDVDSYMKILRFVQHLSNNTAWKSIGTTFVRQEECTNHCKNLTFDTDDYWRCMVRHYAVESNHQVSTCRMGAGNDPTAVVDPYLRVKGIKRLRVADSSVMRNVPSANTNAATMMIGEKAADMIKASRRLKYNSKYGKSVVL